MDLDLMLATLSVTRRPATYAFISLLPGIDAPPLGAGVEAVIAEDEGVTVVCTVEVAAANGWPVDFQAAWLTLGVHSALEAVGLTAAFSAALTADAIPCNVLAGYFHDHLLVPVERADEAIACLEGLRGR